MPTPRRVGGVLLLLRLLAACLPTVLAGLTVLPARSVAGAASNCPAGGLPCRVGWTTAFSDLAPVYGHGDFNGDGADDLLVLQQGSLSLWYGARDHVPVIVALSAVRVERVAAMQAGLAGTEPVVGDFDADGLDDILWATTFDATVDNGQVWYGSSTTGRFTGGPAAATSHDGAATWTVGDFDADGGDDVVWYDDRSGTLQLQLLDGGSKGLQGRNHPDRVTPGLRLLRGDLDGNRADDLLFYDSRSGIGASWFFEGGGSIDARPIEPGRGFRPAMGDVDGDGRADVLWYGPGDQLDAYWFGSADRSFRGAPMAAVGGAAVPLVTDVDGDGRADVLWWEVGPQPDVLWLTRADGPYPIVQDIGPASQVSTPDFDGDGGADLLFSGVYDADSRPTHWALWWFTSAAV